MIHLDTCYLIRALVRGSPEDGRLRKWLRAGERLGISTVGWAELLCGTLQATDHGLAKRIVMERIVFDEEAAQLAAELFNDGGRRRGSLLDCMIAAAAILAQAPLATTNPADFEPFSGQGLTLIR